MFNWFWKRLGYHVCEEFTRWRQRESVSSCAPWEVDWIKGVVRVETVTRYLERECTICGLIQRKTIEKMNRAVMSWEEQERVINRRKHVEREDQSE